MPIVALCSFIQCTSFLPKKLLWRYELLCEFSCSVLLHFCDYPLHLKDWLGVTQWKKNSQVFFRFMHGTCGYYHFHSYSLTCRCGFAFLIVFEYSLCIVTGLQGISLLLTNRPSMVLTARTNSNWRTVWNIIIIACCSVHLLHISFCWKRHLMDSPKNIFGISK